MGRRVAVAACLVFSGLAALVYQLLWTRLLGLAFGTTTESIATVLAVFFAGMALGNLIAARRLVRVSRPLRVYALLELAIGVFALASLPLLRHLDEFFAPLAATLEPWAASLLRLGLAALVLLPPTVAMGATLPVVARGLVADDSTLGRWSGALYAANTFGAVLGAYLCGFWMLPGLGLTLSVGVAGGINLAVAAFVWGVAGSLRAPDSVSEPRCGPPQEASGLAPQGSPHRGAFLVFFGISGFVAIGYEIVWSKVFGIVMEGTLYGFAAVLCAYLLGIAIGSLAMAPRVDRIRNLPRAFGLLHLAIAAAVAAGMSAIPYLPFALRRLAEASGGGDAVHLLFVLVAPIVLLPTALFGAAFPVLIRLYTTRAESVGEGMGIATAVNTGGSILASLAVGFLLIPTAGMDATLYLLLLLDLGVALVVLLRFQPGDLRSRAPSTGLAAAGLVGIALFFGGVQAEKAIAGRTLEAGSLGDYARTLRAMDGSRSFLAEGKTSIVTVHDTPVARTLQNNGLPEAGVLFGPPYLARETVLLGVLPYFLAESPGRALVVGLGGANTIDALERTGLSRIDVVELEPGVLEAAKILYGGRQSPLDDPRVGVKIGDGRHELLLRRHRDEAPYDVIASQPSHPWLAGAANLFTEEYFALAKENLAPGGVFAAWVNGFRTDPESLLALVASFERVFPGALVVDGGSGSPRDSLILLGARTPLSVDVAALTARISEPGIATLLRLFELDSPERVVALFEGPAASFAALAPDAANTDDNAFVETRIPRRLDWARADFGAIEARLPESAPVLPPLAGEVDVATVARALLEASDRRPGSGKPPFARKLERLLANHGAKIDPYVRDVLREASRARDVELESDAIERLRALAAVAPERPDALRALGFHLAIRRRDFAGAGEAFSAAWQRSRDPQDAFDAARALHRVDPALAWTWVDRIPSEARVRFPRLAVYDADRALASGQRGETLRPAYEALLRYRDTSEGRLLQDLPDLLARLADAVGEPEQARRYSDLAYQQRHANGSAALARARQRSASGDASGARVALEEARRAMPADSRVLEFEARLARERGDRDALTSALAGLRTLAPSLEAAIAAENRFCSVLGLPLLPPLDPAELVGAAAPQPSR